MSRRPRRRCQSKYRRESVEESSSDNNNENEEEKNMSENERSDDNPETQGNPNQPLRSNQQQSHDLDQEDDKCNPQEDVEMSPAPNQSQNNVNQDPAADEANPSQDQAVNQPNDPQSNDPQSNDPQSNDNQQQQESWRRGQARPLTYISDYVVYQRQYNRTTKKLTDQFERTNQQNMQFGLMVFYDGRRIGVEQRAEIHFSKIWDLACNIDLVCNFLKFLTNI